MSKAGFDRFYPELNEAGGLAAALQSALSSMCSTLTVTKIESPSLSFAQVKKGSRLSQVFIAAEERLFLFDFWNRGVCMATGKSPEIPLAAGAIDRWIGSECSLDELSTLDFVEVNDMAHAFERGEEVEARWQVYLSSIGEGHPSLLDLVKAAAQHPLLRQLFPFTSLTRLCFSRCTGYPYTDDAPSVVPVTIEGGLYEVRDRFDHPIGRGNADKAVRLVVKNLPPDCGPARPGTADDLKRNTAE